MSKAKNWLIIVLNSLIVITIIVCLYFMGTRNTKFDTFDGVLKWNMFLFVNSDSPVVLGLGSITMIIYAIMFLIQNRPNLHFLRYAYVFKLVGTVWVTFVFLLIVLFLGPMVHYPSYLFTAEQAVLNVVLPILATVIFIFLEYKKTEKTVIVYSAIPAMAYIVAMIAVVYSGLCQRAIGEEAPYDVFNFKTNKPHVSVFACVFLVAGTFGLGTGIYFANWAMFEKVYPRMASRRYQKTLQKLAQENKKVNPQRMQK